MVARLGVKVTFVVQRANTVRPYDETEVFCSVKRKTYDLRLNFQLSIFHFQLPFQTLHYIIYARAVGFVGRAVGALIGAKAKSEVKKIVQNDGVMEKN